MRTTYKLSSAYEPSNRATDQIKGAKGRFSLGSLGKQVKRIFICNPNKGQQKPVLKQNVPVQEFNSLDTSQLSSTFINELLNRYAPDSEMLDSDKPDGGQLLAIASLLHKREGKRVEGLVRLLYAAAYEKLLEENKDGLKAIVSKKFGLIGSNDDSKTRLKTSVLPFCEITVGSRDKISYINDQEARTEMHGIGHLGLSLRTPEFGIASGRLGVDVTTYNSKKYDDPDEYIVEKGQKLIKQMLKQKGHYSATTISEASNYQKNITYLITNKNKIEASLNVLGYTITDAFNVAKPDSSPSQVIVTEGGIAAKVGVPWAQCKASVTAKNIHIDINESKDISDEVLTLLNTDEESWQKNKFNSGRLHRLVDVVGDYHTIKTKFIDKLMGAGEGKRFTKVRVDVQSTIKMLSMLSDRLGSAEDRKAFTGGRALNKKALKEISVFVAGLLSETYALANEKDKQQIAHFSSKLSNQVIALNGNKSEGISLLEKRTIDINFKTLTLQARTAAGLVGASFVVNHINKQNHDYYKRGQFITLDFDVSGGILNAGQILDAVSEHLDIDRNAVLNVENYLNAVGVDGELGKKKKIVFFKPEHSSKYLPFWEASGNFQVLNVDLDVPNIGGLSFDKQKTKMQNFVFRKEQLSFLLLNYHTKMKLGTWDLFKQKHRLGLEAILSHIATNTEIQNEIKVLCEIFKKHDTDSEFNYHDLIAACEKYGNNIVSYELALDSLEHFFQLSAKHHQWEKNNYENRQIKGYA
jgi:hypothetical protein